MTTGQLIKAARKKAGLTQLELAQKLKVPFQSVSQWERDLRNPKPETIEKIANAIGVDYMDLVPQKLQGPYFAAYMLRHPEITVEDEHGNIIIQGTGRVWNPSLKPEINISGGNDAEVERGILIQAAAEAQVDGSIRIHVSPEQHEYGELMKKYADGTISVDELHRLGELQAQRPPFKESFGMLKTTLDRMKRCLDPLNEEGQQKVIEHAEAYAQDLAEIPRYRRQEPAEAPPASPKDTDTPTEQDAAEGAGEGE